MTISFQELKQQNILSYKSLPNTPQSNSQVSTDKVNVDEYKLSQKLLLALGGLAVLGSGALLVYNSIKKGKMPPSNKYSLQRIEKFIKSLHRDTQTSLANHMQKRPLKNSIFVKALVGKEQDILPLEYLFKLKELRLRNVPDLPPLINLENISAEKAKNITQILSGQYKTAFFSTKYTNGFMEEFFETLTKISQNSKENYKNNKQYTFLNIENIDTLLNDLKKTNNEEYLNKFKELIASNVNNRLIYVTKGENKELESLQHMKLSFTDEIKTMDLFNDLSSFRSVESDIESIKHNKIMESLSDYLDNSIVQTLSHFAWKQDKSNILFFDNATAKTTNQFLEKLQTIVDDKFINIDVEKAGFKKLNEEILTELPKANDLFNRENKQTFVYLEGLEDLVSKTEKDSEDFIKFKEIIKNSIEDSNLRLIIKNEKQNEVLNSLKSNGTLSFKFFKNPEFSKLYKETREKIGISQRELSRRTGIDNNTLAKIEKGERKKPNVLSLRKISFLLNLDLEELLKLAGYNDQDIEVALNQRNFIISSGNSTLIVLEDMINRNKDEVIARNILKELGPKIDYNEIDFINKMNSKDRNKSIKIFKNFLKDNDKEIKKLSDQIEEELKILNEKTN